MREAERERLSLNQDNRDFNNVMRYGAECEKRQRIGGYTAGPIAKVTAAQVEAGECKIQLQVHRKSLKIQIKGSQLVQVHKKLEEGLFNQWVKCGYCNKWRNLPDGSFAWPKNKWFGCDDAGVTCLTKATRRPRPAQ